MTNIILLKLALIEIPGLLVYYFIPRRWQNYWLLFLSYVFYVSWNWMFGLSMAVLTVFNFVVAHEIERTEKRKPFILWIGILGNVASLLILKYPLVILPERIFGIVRPAFSLTGFPITSPADILLPLGYSFLILQTISYLVDVSRSQCEAEPDLIDFALYIAYFPKLISGPIEPARRFIPLLKTDRIVDNDQLDRSFILVVVGIFRKVAIADMLFALTPPDVLASPGEFHALALIKWLFVYAFAIYNDFAGYTSIVRGVSGFFGIELQSNFQRPYFAHNFAEFWNRWHITFSHWLREYIFFPARRALQERLPDRNHPLNIALPPLLTMIVSGLWHAIAPGMLLWGVMHAVYQIVGRFVSMRAPRIPISKRPAWRRALAILGTFILVTLAWIPFSLSWPVSLGYARGILMNWRSYPLPGFDGRFLIPIIPALGLDILQENGGELVFLKWNRLAQASILAVGVILILMAFGTETTSQPFIYQGF